MRKILLATSALVAAASFTASANAAAPVMTMSGAVQYYYVSESYDTAEIEGVDQIKNATGTTEIKFDINAEADNGLSYGGAIDWRAQNNTLDEVYVDFAGAWGTVVLGHNDGAASDNVPNGSSVLVGSGGYNGSYAAGTSQQVGDAAAGPSATGGTVDAAKITYLTPSMGGITAGISHTPDDNASTANATTEVFAAWSGDIGAASLTVAAGHYMAPATTGNSDLASTEFGVKVGFGDFAVAVGLVENGDSNITSGSTADAGSGVHAGVSYSFGDTAVSLGYIANTIDMGSTDDEYTNIAFDVNHNVAEGLSVFAGLQIAESKDGADATSMESTSIILGTAVSF